MKKILLLMFVLSFKSNLIFAQVSTIVSLDSSGRLVYQSDAKGNKVPDFSGVGYMNGEAPIPSVAVVRTVDPVTGDNLSNIQNAINYVAGLSPDVNGIRGAILFRRGTYNISDTIKITAGGIILRGEGTDSSTGTNFVATKQSQHTLIYFLGPQYYNRVTSSKKAIVDAYVPYGAKQFSVASGHTFQVGNSILVHTVPNQAWVHMLHMDSLSYINPSMTGITNWTPSAYDIYYERKITAVNGDLISIDAPLTDLLDSNYVKGEVYKYSERRIQNCGIENIRLTSMYASEYDNNHGWDAVAFNNSINCWATNVDVYYFGHSAVSIQDASSWITVQNCKMIDGKSTLAGGERYSFNIDGQRSLVRDCFTRNGRHDFVTGSRTAGPNVFYNCVATLQQADIGPHQRWSTGVLFDNIVGDGFFAVQNRTNSGTGHGWAGAETMFWNCAGQRLVLQDPEGDNTNWAVGCRNWITGVGDLGTWPLGVVESEGTSITAIPSLFLMQLNARLGSSLAVKFTNIKVEKRNTSSLINWSAVNNNESKLYVVQWSIDGKNFIDIGVVNNNCFNERQCDYSFTHMNPSLGINYYRVKQLDQKGVYTNSNIVQIQFVKNSFLIKNNIVDNYIYLTYNDFISRRFFIFDDLGRLVMTKSIKGTNHIDISILKSGIYFIKNEQGETVKFIKNK